MVVGEVIKKIPFFEGLSETDISYITNKLRFMNYPVSSTICKIDDPGDQMFIIISGKVKVCIYAANNEEQQVAELSGGMYFGEMSLLTEEPRTATVITTEEAEMFILHKDQFDEILARFPSIQLVLGKIMSQRLRQNLTKAMEMSKNAAAKNVKQKTASGKIGPDKSIGDVMGFCDMKALTGDIKIENGSQTATISYDGGQIMYVRCGSKKDDEALDEILEWETGKFIISPREISFEELVGDQKPATPVTNLVLIVSNSLVVRRLLEKKITQLGMTVKTARNVSAAIDIIFETTPKLVIADIKFDDGSVLNLNTQANDKGVDTNYIVLGDGKLSDSVSQLVSGNKNVHLTESHDVTAILNLVKSF